MATLFDIFKYNNKSYNELTDVSQIETIDRLIEKIRQNEMEEIILKYPDRYFGIETNRDSEYTIEYASNLPDDLMKEIMKVYVNL